MVTLREWWSERWQNLAEWQQALAVTVVGGLTLNYGLPLLESVSDTLSTFSQIAVGGILVIGVLFLWTRQRIVRLETELEALIERIVELQHKSLLRLENVAESVSSTTPDGGKRAEQMAEEFQEWEENMSARNQTPPSTGTLFVVALIGSIGGLLVALGFRLGDIGSPIVTIVSLLGGFVLVGAGELWTRGGREKRDNKPNSLIDIRDDSWSEDEIGHLLETRLNEEIESGDARFRVKFEGEEWSLYIEEENEDGESTE